MGRLAPHLVLQDAVVPRTRLADVLARIAGDRRRAPRDVANFFHAGDGNLHPTIPYDAHDADEAARVHAAMSAIMQACIDAGGTITGEHGVGLDKQRYMEPRLRRRVAAAPCAGCATCSTPTRRANPGKVVPIARVPRVARRAGAASMSVHSA